MLTRREIIAAGAATGLGYAAASAIGARSELMPIASANAAVPPNATRVNGPLTLTLAERRVALPCFRGAELPLWTFDETGQTPILRLAWGQRLDVKLKNKLPRAGEHATIHWHGLRVTNGQDGVAYITQQPIQPGGEGHYSFTPPDTGTYFFHTHCNSVEHFGRGLFGALIVEGDEQVASDAEVVLMMKDWHLGADGAFLPFSTDDKASRAGTFGSVRAVNGIESPQYPVPASANVRVRMLNVDPSRIFEFGCEGAEATLIAVDGSPCDPVRLETWRLGPAQRLDLLIRSPVVGEEVQFYDYFAPKPVLLATLRAEGPARRKDNFSVKALKPHDIKPPDLAQAQRLTFDFSATATGAAISALGEAGQFPVGSLCLSRRTFWAINKQSWSSVDHKDLGPALAKLKRGKTYIFELNNTTQQAHPIHIHGHTFDVLSSSLRKLPPHRADTVLLLPRERIEIAFVADNPGRWMFHCHILEHQETGMMGHIEVA